MTRRQHPHARDAFDRVIQLSMLITSDMARFERETGLTPARTHLLWALGAGGPATQQQLAAALDVTPRNVTGLVDGLVASGHVTREPHPTDRRATLVTPTAHGEEAIKELQTSSDDLADQLFGNVDPLRLAGFTAVLDDTIARFAQLMEEVGR